MALSKKYCSGINFSRSLIPSEFGQSLVETALVLPLFLFIVLGTIQMGLVYQSSYLLKYAAYRVARTGALHHACNDAMTDAAIAVLAPIVGTGYPTSGNKILTDGYSNLEDEMTAYSGALLKAKVSVGPAGRSIVQVSVCGPTTAHLENATKISGSKQNQSTQSEQGDQIDFDDPRNLLWEGNNLGKETLRQFERMKLRIQVQYLQQLVIPLANWLIFYAWAGMNIPKEFRMQMNYATSINVPGVVPSAILPGDQGHGHRHQSDLMPILYAHSQSTHRYFLPIHANYAFRMQSNLLPTQEGCEIPEKNECWHYTDGEDGAI